MKYTPGPWEARLIPNSLGESNNHWEVNADSPHCKGKHQQICEMNGPWNPSNYKANAKLIAAAPEMLQRIISVRSLVAREAGGLANGGLGESYLKQLLADLDETIKKATE